MRENWVVRPFDCRCPFLTSTALLPVQKVFQFASILNIFSIHRFDSKTTGLFSLHPQKWANLPICMNAYTLILPWKLLFNSCRKYFLNILRKGVRLLHGKDIAFVREKMKPNRRQTIQSLHFFWEENNYMVSPCVLSNMKLRKRYVLRTAHSMLVLQVGQRRDGTSFYIHKWVFNIRMSVVQRFPIEMLSVLYIFIDFYRFSCPVFWRWTIDVFRHINIFIFHCKQIWTTAKILYTHKFECDTVKALKESKLFSDMNALYAVRTKELRVYFHHLEMDYIWMRIERKVKREFGLPREPFQFD